jgi:hypothetical protein
VRPNADEYDYKTSINTASEINSVMRMPHGEFVKWVDQQVNGSKHQRVVNPTGIIEQFDRIVSGPGGIRQSGDTITEQAKGDTKQRLYIIGEILAIDPAIVTDIIGGASKYAGSSDEGSLEGFEFEKDMELAEAMAQMPEQPQVPEGEFDVEPERLPLHAPLMQSGKPYNDSQMKDMDHAFERLKTIVPMGREGLPLKEGESKKQDMRMADHIWQYLLESESSWGTWMDLDKDDPNTILNLAPHIGSMLTSAGLSEWGDHLADHLHEKLYKKLSDEQLKELKKGFGYEGSYTPHGTAKAEWAIGEPGSPYSAAGEAEPTSTVSVGEAVPTSPLAPEATVSVGEAVPTSPLAPKPDDEEWDPLAFAEIPEQKPEQKPDDEEWDPLSLPEIPESSKDISRIPGMKAAVDKAGFVLGETSLVDMMANKGVAEILNANQGWSYGGPLGEGIEAVKLEINMVGEPTENIIKAIDTIIAYDQRQVSPDKYQQLLKSTKFRELAEYPPDKLDMIKRMLIDASKKEVATSKKKGPSKG